MSIDAKRAGSVLAACLLPAVALAEFPVALGSRLPEPVTVMPLDPPGHDRVGLIPAEESGLSRDLWAGSTVSGIEARLDDLPEHLPHTMTALLRTMLVAELDPPASDGDGSRSFLEVRVRELLSRGFLDDAHALLRQAGPRRQKVFPLWFETSLLIDEIDPPCAAMGRDQRLAPSFNERIFCLARDGDWRSAAVTLHTAEALHAIEPEMADLLALYLDPEADIAEPIPPRSPTALEVQLFEATGMPLPTSRLPIVFAHRDLRTNVGWKARLGAAERLARAGALSGSRLIDIYSERLPAASGGVWDRVEAVQRLNAALQSANSSAIAAALPTAWRQMRSVGLAVPFAHLYGRALLRHPLSGAARDARTEIVLLSPAYQDAPDISVAAAVAGGKAIAFNGREDMDDAIRAAFDPSENSDLSGEVHADPLGETLIRSIGLVSAGADGNGAALADAVSFFRSIGMLEIARRAALEVLILRDDV